MYNTDFPRRADLPTSAQLRRSTIIAALSAAAILVTVVLPSEYAIDPTGVGRMMGLTQMGEIKAQLAEEATNDAAAPPSEPVDERPAVAVAEPVPAIAERTTSAPAIGRSDEVSFTLTPGQGAEIKLVMRQGARVGFAWASSGGPVNYDTHGDAPGQSTSYEKGRGVEGDEGVLEAAFDGNHGWFWRNRGRADVTVTLRVNGDYIEIKRVV